MTDDFGSKIRELRESEGISRDDFAQMLGISRGGLVNIETGARRPGLDTVAAIAKRWPQYAVWLLTGEATSSAASTSPAVERARTDSVRDRVRG